MSGERFGLEALLEPGFLVAPERGGKTIRWVDFNNMEYGAVTIEKSDNPGRFKAEYRITIVVDKIKRFGVVFLSKPEPMPWLSVDGDAGVMGIPIRPGRYDKEKEIIEKIMGYLREIMSDQNGNA